MRACPSRKSWLCGAGSTPQRGQAADGRPDRSILNLTVRLAPGAPPQPGIVTGPPKQVVSQLQDLITHYGFTGFNFLPSHPDDLPRLAEDVLPELTR